MSAAEIAEDIISVFRTSIYTPYDTGRLKFDSIRYVSLGPNTAEVIIGGEKAPYAEYLEENEFVGKTAHLNRHKGFIESIFEQECIPYLEVKYGGKGI